MIISIDEKNKLTVTKSCGCVFCDLKIERFKMKRNYIHHVKYRCFTCTNENLLTYRIGKKK